MSNHRKFIPMTAWPSCDRELWQAATADDGLFSRGAAADWSHGSRTSISASYGRWIGWIAATMPEDLDLAVDERVNGARVKLYVEMLQSEVSAITTVAYLKHLHLAIRAMCPEID
jgi:hypothetical protein